MCYPNGNRTQISATASHYLNCTRVNNEQKLNKDKFKVTVRPEELVVRLPGCSDFFKREDLKTLVLDDLK